MLPQLEKKKLLQEYEEHQFNFKRSSQPRPHQRKQLNDNYQVPSPLLAE